MSWPFTQPEPTQAKIIQTIKDTSNIYQKIKDSSLKRKFLIMLLSNLLSMPESSTESFYDHCIRCSTEECNKVKANSTKNKTFTLRSNSQNAPFLREYNSTDKTLSEIYQRIQSSSLCNSGIEFTNNISTSNHNLVCFSLGDDLFCIKPNPASHSPPVDSKFKALENSMKKKFKLMTINSKLSSLEPYENHDMSLLDIYNKLKNSAIQNPVIEFIPNINAFDRDFEYFTLGDEYFCIKPKLPPQNASVDSRQVSGNSGSPPGTMVSRINDSSFQGRNPVVERPGDLPIGLYNQGNTCYMNCILQVFAHFYASFIKDCSEYGPIGGTLRKLLGSMNSYSQEVSRDYEEFRANIGRVNEEYLQSRQLDAKNFYLQILDSLKDETAKASNVFIGKKKTLLICQYNNRAEIVDEIGIVNLGMIRSYGKVQEYVNQYFQTEITQASHQWIYCTECKAKVYGQKSSEFISPEVICLYIDNRNSPTINIQNNSELTIKESRYELACMVQRLAMQGNTTYGHFIALRKISGRWIQFDDYNVSEFKRFDLEGAYLLFYSLVR